MRSISVSGGRPPLLVLAGPTASGKTAVGIELARTLGGEIVSADARQVYRYMNIGTAKPTPGERQAAPHHLIDVVDPDELYSAGRFAREAAGVIVQIESRGRVPLLVGGSGFYLEALLDGFAPIPDIPAGIRRRLQEEARADLAGAYARLLDIDPETAGRLHPNDTQRIVRALEVHEATGDRLSDLLKRPREPAIDRACVWFGLGMDRAKLYRRIEDRVDRMLEAGLVEEVEALRGRGFGPELNALNTFGYREIFAYLDGVLSLEAAAEQIKQGTRRYAKRQLTWFRRRAEMTWVDPAGQDAAEAILQILKNA